MRETAEKKSFLMYYDYRQHFDYLTDLQLGQLVRSLFGYEIDRVVPEFSEPIMKMCFSFVQSNLDRDMQKYIEKCEKNAENGKKGGRPPKIEQPDTSYDNQSCYQSSLDDGTAQKKKQFYDRINRMDNQ